MILLGVPRPIAILLSSLSASLISEEAKFLSRERKEKSKLSEIDGDDKVSSNGDILTAGEIISDVSKWLIYDFLVESTQRESYPLLNAAQYFSFGSIAGTMSFFIKDRDHRLITVNESLLMRFGLDSKEDLIGKTDFDLFPPRLAEHFRREDRVVFETKKPRLNWH